ncbi:MAG: complex I subunit 4 family protein [Vulcanimicrobiaceae bacterium]
MNALGLLLLPFAGAIAVWLLPRDNRTAARAAGTIVALATVALSPVCATREWSFRWLSRPFAAAFHFGATPLSYWLVLLLAVCTACAILASNVPRSRDFVAWMLVLEGSMLGLFLSRDLLAFALFWDAMLLPVFFVLVGWGRHHGTAWRYLIYNFAGGLALLFATAAFGVLNGSTDVIGRGDVHLVGSWVPWIFAGFAFAFLVKTPVFPFHTWMPATYADTPGPMVAVVSGVQSKAGLYGFIAIALAFVPDYLHQYAGLLLALGAISILYGAFVALVQSDAKRVVAYSSLSHLGLIVVAIVAFQPLALAGAVLYMVAHGLFSAALFLAVGFVEEREQTRSLSRLRGLGRDNPRLAGALCVAALAALGLPGLAGFAGEIAILIGIFQAGLVWAAAIALAGIVLAAAYMLRMFQDIMNGPAQPDLPERRDLSWREGLAVAPLALALLVLGVNPHAILAGSAAQSAVTTAAVETAR